MVLADDNFATIVLAVEGGRTIYANITKFVHMMFSHNLGEVLMIFTAIAAGWPLPLLPLQILWMNLVTDVFPALALAVEPPSPEMMNQPPRSSRSTLLSKRFLLLIGWQGLMLGGARPCCVSVGPQKVWFRTALTHGSALRNHRRATWSYVQLPLADTLSFRRAIPKSVHLGCYSNRYRTAVRGCLF